MKHNKEETQKRNETNLYFLFLGCWPLSGQNPARDTKGKQQYETRVFVCLFTCWDVLEQTNIKKNNNNDNNTTIIKQKNQN